MSLRDKRKIRRPKRYEVNAGNIAPHEEIEPWYRSRRDEFKEPRLLGASHGRGTDLHEGSSRMVISGAAYSFQANWMSVGFFKIRKNKLEEIDKCKARLVLNGCSQREGNF